MKPVMLAGLAAAACLMFAPTASSADDEDYDFNQLVEWMEGDFSSKKHSEKDSAYFHVEMHIRRIWKDSDDGAWFYVEQGLPDSKPYRQRVYHIRRIEEGMIESIIYAIPGDSAFIGAYEDLDKFDDISPDDLKQRIGCEVYLQATGESFIGGTHGTACRSDLAGASYATSKVKIFADKIISWDQGFNSSDEQVWGAEKGGYWFFRE